MSESKKKEVIEKYRLHEKDVGSPEVQVALLTGRINDLAKHFAANGKDEHSRVGLLRMVQRRKTLLRYLRAESVDRYKNTISALELRK